MTDEQIIEMAKQAGAIPIHKDFDQLALIGTENVKAFAKLVAQHDCKEIDRLKVLCHELLGELYAYRASEYLKDTTAAFKKIARGEAWLTNTTLTLKNCAKR